MKKLLTIIAFSVIFMTFLGSNQMAYAGSVIIACIPIPEIVADGIDQDCDLVDLCWFDGDGDGFGVSVTQIDNDLDCSNASSPNTAANNLDCDDTNRLLTLTCEVLVGGEFIGIETTSVLAAGAQYTAAWMIPVIISGIGFAIVIARKF